MAKTLHLSEDEYVAAIEADQSRTLDGERLLTEAHAVCRNCGQIITPVIVWESQVVDWEIDGDSGCEAYPFNDDESTGGHVPV